MKTKINIKSIWGKLLFEYEKEDNTLKDTVIEAITKGAYLHGAYLRGAYLHGAYLREADLQGANLQGADLQGADLQRADLHGAYLREADLHGANLRGANLQRADLRGADLQGAYLQRADLHGAYLREADLQGADLQGANLQRADLRGADLQGAEGKELNDLKPNFWIIPEEGSFIAWKKCRNAILKIEIPAEAKRTSNLRNRKCRAEFVKVLNIWDLEGNEIKEAYSLNTSTFIYKVGETTYPDSFDADYFNDCSNGIHFFITRIEAENWD